MRVQTRARGKRTRRGGPNARVCYHFLGSSSCFLLLVSCSSQFNHGPGIQRHRLLNRCSHVFMRPRPVLRVRTRPRPPGDFAARLFVAVIRPPLLFFAMSSSPLQLLLLRLLLPCLSSFTPHGVGLVPVFPSSVTAAIRANALPFSVAPVIRGTDWF